jgi:hypothetical protein
VKNSWAIMIQNERLDQDGSDGSIQDSLDSLRLPLDIFVARG